MTIDKTTKAVFELVVNHFIDDAINGVLTEKDITLFLESLCADYGYYLGNEEELKDVYESLIENNTEAILQSLVDPWNNLKNLKMALNDTELKYANNVQNIMDKYWDSNMLPGKLDGELRALLNSDNKKLLGTEFELWAREIKRIIICHKRTIISQLNDYVSPNIQYDDY